jgi:hypothetical protein
MLKRQRLACRLQLQAETTELEHVTAIEIILSDAEGKDGFPSKMIYCQRNI